VLSTVGALSVNATLLFSALVWAVGLLGTVIGSKLIDRIGRRKLCYISAIPHGITALILSVYGQSSPVVLIIGFFVLAFAVWVGISVLVWVWASELFPTHLRGRSQGFCNACCRLAISANIFIVPIALSSFGFSLYIGLLSIPMFLLAFIVSRNDFFEGSQKDLDELGEAA
jgi:MFS transporter, putative metabolite transport protein